MPRQPLEMGRRVVRLSSVPLEIRVAEARALIDEYRLGPVDAVMLAAAAELPVEDPGIFAPEWKIERVLAGKRVSGRVPKDLW